MKRFTKMTDQNSRECTECGNRAFKASMEIYWIKVGEKKGYRCPRCIKLKEGGPEAVEAFDTAHDPRYKDVIHCPVSVDIKWPVHLKPTKNPMGSRHMLAPGPNLPQTGFEKRAWNLALRLFRAIDERDPMKVVQILKVVNKLQQEVNVFAEEETAKMKG